MRPVSGAAQPCHSWVFWCLLLQRRRFPEEGICNAPMLRDGLEGIVVAAKTRQPSAARRRSGSAQDWRLTLRAALWSCAVLFFDTLRFLHSTTAVAASDRASEICWYLRECAASRTWRGGGTAPHQSLSERWNAVGDPRYLRHDGHECDLSTQSWSIVSPWWLPVPPESVLPATRAPCYRYPPCPAPDAINP